MVLFLLLLGETDCETIGSGLLAQPVNALSSLAFVVAGAFVLVRGAHMSGRRWLGSLLVLVGVGSFAFHGPQPPGARWLHDWSIGTLFLFIGVWGWSWLRGRRFRLLPFLVATAAFGVVAGVAPEAARPVVVVLGVLSAMPAAVKVVSDRVPVPGALAGATALFLVALTLSRLGRTGAPWCDPRALLQPHAAWHLLAAAAGAWFAVPFLELTGAIGPGKVSEDIWVA